MRTADRAKGLDSLDGAPVAVPVIIEAADDADDAPLSGPQKSLDIGIDATWNHSKSGPNSGYTQHDRVSPRHVTEPQGRF